MTLSSKKAARMALEAWLQQASKSPARARLEESVAWEHGRREYIWIEHALFAGVVCTTGYPSETDLITRGNLPPRAEGMARDWVRSLARELVIKLQKSNTASTQMDRTDWLFETGAWDEISFSERGVL